MGGTKRQGRLFPRVSKNMDHFVSKKVEYAAQELARDEGTGSKIYESQAEMARNGFNPLQDAVQADGEEEIQAKTCWPQNKRGISRPRNTSRWKAAALFALDFLHFGPADVEWIELFSFPCRPSFIRNPLLPTGAPD
jgi:hypothetical protein